MTVTHQFSRQTIVEAVSLIEEWDQSKIERLILKFELENKLSYKELNRPQLANRIIHYLIGLNGEKEKQNQEFIYRVVEHIAAEIKEPKGDIPAFMGNQLFSDPAEKLKNSLHLDGYELENGKLKQIFPAVSSLGKNTDKLRDILDEKGLKNAIKLLDQAFNAHTQGEWKEAEQSIAKFVDEVAVQTYKNHSLFTAISDYVSNEDTSGSEKESTFRIQVATLIAVHVLS